MQQLKDATELTKSLSKALQDEVVLNAGARIAFKKDIQRLCELVDEIHTIFKSSGDRPSLDVRLTSIEKSIEMLKEKHTDEEKDNNTRQDRFWQFMIQNSPIMLTWLVVLMWWIIQWAISGTPPIPP